MMNGPNRSRFSVPTELSRRRLLQTSGAAGLAGLAGCSQIPFFGRQRRDGEVTIDDYRGSGPLVASRPALDGPRIADLPDLEGDLTIYLGGGEGGLYEQLIELFERTYPEFTAETRLEPSAQLANTIIEEQEGGGSLADVFWAVDAGSLGAVANAGYTATLPDAVVDPVPAAFHPGDDWVGVAGRARAIPYNTERFAASDIPSDIQAFPEEVAAAAPVGWAPTYGAFQSFVTAMRLLEGADATRQWLRSVIDRGASQYPNEFLVSNAVADGELGAGFANHYYALRVRESRPNASLDLAFTRGDAGALVNVSGTAIVAGTDAQSLAELFVRHLLTAESQEFFATRAYAYPMIPGVPPVGGLPTVDELEPPDISLAELSAFAPTIELLREVGLL